MLACVSVCVCVRACVCVRPNFFCRSHHCDMLTIYTLTLGFGTRALHVGPHTGEQKGLGSTWVLANPTSAGISAFWARSAILGHFSEHGTEADKGRLGMKVSATKSGRGSGGQRK